MALTHLPLQIMLLWVTWCPSKDMFLVSLQEEGRTHRGEDHVKTEVELRVSHPQAMDAQDGQAPTEARRAGRSIPWSPQRVHGPAGFLALGFSPASVVVLLT